MGDGSNRDNLLRVNLTNTSHVRSQFPYVVRRLGEATYKGVGPEVVSLDVVKVRRILERGVFPIQIFHPPVFHQFQSDIQHTRIYPRKHMKHNKPVDIRVPMTNIADVAFEVPNIDRVEANLQTGATEIVRHPKITRNKEQRGKAAGKRTMVTQSLISASVN